MKYVFLISSKIKTLFLFNITAINSSKSLAFAILYISSIICLSSCFFVDLVEFFKTAANLIDPYIGGNHYIWFFIVLLSFVLIYIFLKSLLEVLLKIFFRNNIQSIQIKFSFISFIIVAVIIVTGLLACFNKINSELALRKHDIVTIRKINNLLSNKKVDYKLYVSKVP